MAFFFLQCFYCLLFFFHLRGYLFPYFSSTKLVRIHVIWRLRAYFLWLKFCNSWNYEGLHKCTYTDWSDLIFCMSCISKHRPENAWLSKTAIREEWYHWWCCLNLCWLKENQFWEDHYILEYYAWNSSNRWCCPSYAECCFSFSFIYSSKFSY